MLSLTSITTSVYFPCMILTGKKMKYCKNEIPKQHTFIRKLFMHLPG